MSERLFENVRQKENETAAALLRFDWSVKDTQGELTPLEIGLHALERVDKAQGKRGGGLTEYAKLLGKSLTSISELRSAAEVYKELLRSTEEVSKFDDKATHLLQIHAAPREAWPLLAAAMLAGDWSVKDTHNHVLQITRQNRKR